jgi:hypothetical protein
VDSVVLFFFLLFCFCSESVVDIHILVSRFDYRKEAVEKDEVEVGGGRGKKRKMKEELIEKPNQGGDVLQKAHKCEHVNSTKICSEPFKNSSQIPGFRKCKRDKCRPE